MKVLVTGGAGFIGLHVAEKLLNEKVDVVIVDSQANNRKEKVPGQATLYNIGIEEKRLESIFTKEKPDYVVHLAAQVSVKNSMDDPFLDALVNICGTVNVLENCSRHGVKKLVFASSAAVYGEPAYLPIDEKHPLRPSSFYALSKQTAEDYIRLFSEHTGLNYCILRFANVYGPGQNAQGEAGVISIFLDRLLKGQAPVLFGGKQTRDFVYVKDVAEAVVLSLGYEGNSLFNVCTNKETAIKDVLDQLKSKLQSGITPVFLPPREGDLISSRLNPSRIKRELSWKEQYSLDKGLEETIRSFTEKKKSSG